LPLPFTPSEPLTLGVEVELQIIDPESKDLVPLSPGFFERLGPDNPHIRPEIIQSMIEVSTGICKTVADVRRDLHDRFMQIQQLGNELGVRFATAGSHPFARHRELLIFPAERYAYLIDRNQWVARRLMIFGVHVHVGMRDAHHAMAMNNAMLPYLPHFLALSASSPFWQGSDTGLASTRVTVFEALPTAGHPETFRTWQAFENFYDSLVASRSIVSIKDIWWDLRPHPDYGTIELRICDGLATLQETCALVALVQCVYAWSDERYRDGDIVDPPAGWIIRENKWKASRYGLEAEIILNERGETALLRDEVNALVERMRPFADRLACSSELEDVVQMIRSGPSYVRQRNVFERTKDFVAVTDHLMREFEEGRPLAQ